MLHALKQYKSRSPALPDLLNYAALVDDGVVLNKDGSFLSGYFFSGDDLASSTAEERNARSARVNTALARLGSNWMAHIDAVRFEARAYPAVDESHFPDPISRLIDQERREQFEGEGGHYESVYALTLAYLPPRRAESQVISMMLEEVGEGRENSQKHQGSKALRYFCRQRDELIDELSSVLRFTPMRTVSHADKYGQKHVYDELLQYLNYCVTGVNHLIHLPPCPMYLDSVLGRQELWGGITPRVGDKYIGVVAIDGFPQESYPNMLDALQHISCEYRWSSRLLFNDPPEAIRSIKAYRRRWQQRVRGIGEQVLRTGKGVVDHDALRMVEDSEAAYAEATGRQVSFCYYTSVIVLMDEDLERVQEEAREIQQLVRYLGFGCRVETVNTIEAWLGSIPGHGVQNIRRPMINTQNASDLLPLSSVWHGTQFNPCPFFPENSPPLVYTSTNGSTPFRLNLHVGDVGHTLVFGPTGSGKSTLLALIVAQFRRYKDATVFAFDKGGSLLPITLACGGNYYDIGKSSLNFCPLSCIDSDHEQAWCEEWIATLVELQTGTPVTPRHRVEIHKAMSLTRASCDYTLTDFCTNLQDEHLREAMNHYTLQGAMGSLLDAPSDGLSLGMMETFELDEFLQHGEKNVLPVLLYLFHRIEKRLNGNPTLLVLDEAWLMLGHQVFREKIREWLKVLRKKNCSVILATQSLSDAVRSDIVDVLTESCPTKIYLPNPKARETGSRKFYEDMGLNDAQINIIADSVPKREYYYDSPDGSRLFELNLGPVAMSFVGASGKADLASVLELYQEYGEEWTQVWLRRRGISFGAEGLSVQSLS